MKKNKPTVAELLQIQCRDNVLKDIVIQGLLQQMKDLNVTVENNIIRDLLAEMGYTFK